MKKYDLNKDGFLDFSECKLMLNEALGYANDSDTEWFIGQLDTDSDGKLSYSEIKGTV